jgi:amino acid permease
MHTLYKTSLFGLVCAVFGISVVMYTNLFNIFALKQDNYSEKINFNKLPELLGVIVYAGVLIGNIFQIRESMADRKKFTFVFNISILAVFTLFLSFVVTNLFSYGENIKEIAFLNLPYSGKL